MKNIQSITKILFISLLLSYPFTSFSQTTVCENEDVFIILNASVGTIQWQESIDLATWVNIQGATADSLHITATNTMYYRASVIDGTCNPVFSDTSQVIVQAAPATPTAGTHIAGADEIEWHWSNVTGATGYKYNTSNDYGTATDNGTSTTHNHTSLICETPYTLYIWAYNSCGVSTALTLNESTTACPFVCGNSVTFTYNGLSVTYGTVISADNKCWLDRNLGATAVATSSTHTAAYGDLFQWGRLDDGHQVRTTGTTTTRSTSDTPGHSNFIKYGSSPYDWRNPSNDNLWQGVSGINNPCPSGWRVPTFAEWDTERLSWGSNNAAGAFASPLKLTMAGGRWYSSGDLFDVGSCGRYHSSSVSSTKMRPILFNSGWAWEDTSDNYRQSGYSLRCIKD